MADEAAHSTMDCPACDGIGYVVPDAAYDLRNADYFLTGAQMPTVSLAEPESVARHAGRKTSFTACLQCRGSGVWCTLEDLEQWVEALVINEDWVHEQGLLVGTDVATVRRNVHDLADTGAPVLLRGEEVRELRAAFQLVRYTAERQLARSASMKEPDE